MAVIYVCICIYMCVYSCINFVPATCLMSSFDIPYRLVTGFRTDSGCSHAPPPQRVGHHYGASQVDFIEKIFALGTMILF